MVYLFGGCDDHVRAAARPRLRFAVVRAVQPRHGKAQVGEHPRHCAGDPCDNVPVRGHVHALGRAAARRQRLQDAHLGDHGPARACRHHDDPRRIRCEQALFHGLPLGRPDVRRREAPPRAPGQQHQVTPPCKVPLCVVPEDRPCGPGRHWDGQRAQAVRQHGLVIKSRLGENLFGTAEPLRRLVHPGPVAGQEKAAERGERRGGSGQPQGVWQVVGLVVVGLLGQRGALCAQADEPALQERAGYSPKPLLFGGSLVESPREARRVRLVPR